MGISFSNVKCDLSEEEVEEIRILSSFPPNEIRRVRNKFLEITLNQNTMSKEQFLSIPAIAASPFHERLFKCFTSKSNEISFKDFVINLCIFSYYGHRELKIRHAFKIHDFDEDGKISRNDLENYLLAASDFGELEEEELKKKIQNIATKMMEEGSSDPNFQFLSFDDFVKIISSTDFETKFLINF